MPWNESNYMDERIKFVARLLDGENMSRMCREFGISRKTGYKIFNRYKDFGLAGLQDQLFYFWAHRISGEYHRFHSHNRNVEIDINIPHIRK